MYKTLSCKNSLSIIFKKITTATKTAYDNGLYLKESKKVAAAGLSKDYSKVEINCNVLSQFNECSQAFILGHEDAHFLIGNFENKHNPHSINVNTAIERFGLQSLNLVRPDYRSEILADIVGCCIAIKAGYKNALQGAMDIFELLKTKYPEDCKAENPNDHHPRCDDRITILKSALGNEKTVSAINAFLDEPDSKNVKKPVIPEF